MTIILHPLTVGSDNKPSYSADDFRRTNTVWLSPSDSSIGAASACVSGIRNEVDGPICTLSDLTVTVKAHTGIVYPFHGGSPYTYYIDDETVTLDSATQSYKIAIVVSDPSAGIGTTPGATLQALPATTPDNSINGLVLAQVAQGVVNDLAPRLLSGTVIQTQTLTALQQIKTTDGQKGRVATTSDTYTYLNGVWVADKAGPEYVESKIILDNKLGLIRGTRYGKVVMLNMTFSYPVETSLGAHDIGTIPTGWRPTTHVHIRDYGTDGYYSREIIVLDDGLVEYVNHTSGSKNWATSYECTYLIGDSYNK